jgi:hypothetical protein
MMASAPPRSERLTYFFRASRHIIGNNLYLILGERGPQSRQHGLTAVHYRIDRVRVEDVAARESALRSSPDPQRDPTREM